VYIDGHAVLKTNNYVVKGMSYSYADNSQLDTAPSVKRRVNAASSSTVDGVAKKPKTMTPSPQEVKRTLHNEGVVQAKESKQGLRRAFLKENAEVLKPFLEDYVYQGIMEDTTAVSVAYVSERVSQPKLVTGGTLRDYQLDGLQFIVDCHRQNLGCILGDEMGLGE
jgi:SNF2 family DNA or RNA helicase